MSATEVLRYAAFSTTPEGGNPAGVVLSAQTLDDATMQQIATDVGYAETAFITEHPLASDPRRARIRYFSPMAEVPFCGHATVATAVALAEREGLGRFTFETSVGPIELSTRNADGWLTASFTSVPPVITAMPDDVRSELLDLLGLNEAGLRTDYPPRLANAGNNHPTLVLTDAAVFDNFSFDPDQLRQMMSRRQWPATVIVVLVIGAGEFEARNLFPVGTITEDPATGAAAAAFGGYLRELHLVTPPTDVVINQGRHVGRPSRLLVHIPESGGIVVTGAAVPIKE